MSCVIDECRRLCIARQMCSLHYQRWRKHNDPRMVPINRGNRTPRVLPERRTCLDCGLNAAREEFPRGRNVCRPCQNARQTSWKAANPDKVQACKNRNMGTTRERERRRRASRKGIDPDAVDAYRSGHSGRCDICDNPCPSGRDLAVDHDHGSGQFRGLLCMWCNNGLGQFRDDPSLLAAAIGYLQVSPGDLAKLIEAKVPA